MYKYTREFYFSEKCLVSDLITVLFLWSFNSRHNEIFFHYYMQCFLDVWPRSRSLCCSLCAQGVSHCVARTDHKIKWQQEMQQDHQQAGAEPGTRRGGLLTRNMTCSSELFLFINSRIKNKTYFNNMKHEGGAAA